MLFICFMYLLFLFFCFSFLKLMAYVLEGRRSSASRTGSRPSHRGYEKLKNINDVISIDDANLMEDKEAIILKT